MKWSLIFLLFALFSMTSSGPIIKTKYPFLKGEYKLAYVVDGKGKKDLSQLKDVYTLKIDFKDRLDCYKNGKRVKRYEFSSQRSPAEIEQNYVLFNTEDGFYPLYYYQDTLWNFRFPYDYEDCYFVKLK